MKKLVSICSFILLCLLLSSNRPVTPNPIPGPYLGFNLMPGANSNLVSFGLVRILPDGRKVIKSISRNEFIRLACGQCHEDANPTGENLFAKYEVDECGLYRDSIFKKASFICGSLDLLWKLRYQRAPYGGSDTIGWTGSTVPSRAQMNILKQYGAENLDDFIYGENAFKLLHDMQSFAWQSKYKSN
ncbi:MAG: hypothetical protein ACHQRM_02645 [Bacteroidia bacterium]